MFISYLHSAWAFSMFAIKPDNWMRTCAVTARCAVAAAFAVAFALMNSATAVTISTDTIIGPGSNLNDEFINIVDGDDGPTTVSVIEGGSIRGFSAQENSHVILDGGNNTFRSELFDQATFTMISGEFGCTSDLCGGLVLARDQTALHFVGGVLGGDFNIMGLFDNSIANFFGMMLSKTPLDNSVFVSGVYVGGSQFSTSIVLFPPGNPQIVLHEIPEPATLSLLVAISMFIFIRSRR